MQTVFLLAHNVRSGMFDYRMYDPVPCARPVQVFELFQKTLDGIVVDKDRALAEVRADYSTTTEIADALLQKAAVPFRIGHHFASRLTDYGRSHALKLHEIPFAEAARIYTADTGEPLPLSEHDLRKVVSAEYMVFGRRGIGGPQIAEVNRMLADGQAHVAADRNWLKERRDAARRASAALDAAFSALATA
jgi:argininosuccinate lyase